MEKNISYEQVLFQQQHADEIDVIVSNYKQIMSKICGNSLFMLSHNELLNKGYDLYDYVENKDITSTTLDKLCVFIDEVTNVLNSSEHKELQETAELVARIKSRIKSRKNENK